MSYAPSTLVQPENVGVPNPARLIISNVQMPVLPPGEIVPAPLFQTVCIGRLPGSTVLVTPAKLPKSFDVTHAPPVRLCISVDSDALSANADVKPVTSEIGWACAKSVICDLVCVCDVAGASMLERACVFSPVDSDCSASYRTTPAGIPPAGSCFQPRAPTPLVPSTML